MATGASTADVAILLVDARHGVRPQTRRHARIASLLGISNFVLAVNKMDLVEFDQRVFDGICQEFSALAGNATLTPIPMSALHGDNVTTTSDRTPWYDGPSLLEYLETVTVHGRTHATGFRLPVQLVLRPDHDFRGYAGQIASGTVRIGDEVTAWPSGRTSRVKRIVTWEGDLDSAVAPMSVTLVLEDEIDVSRGDVLATGDIHVGKRFTAHVVWMDERPLDPGRTYVVKHNTRSVTADIDRPLELNEIGLVNVSVSRPLVFDAYQANRTTGSFVLIDAASNFTAGAGMIVRPLDTDGTEWSGGAAARVAYAARAAATPAEAEAAVRQLLEELLT
jgi:bifunctional enzyme CysN/CysC